MSSGASYEADVRGVWWQPLDANRETAAIANPLHQPPRPLQRPAVRLQRLPLHYRPRHAVATLRQAPPSRRQVRPQQKGSTCAPGWGNGVACDSGRIGYRIYGSDRPVEVISASSHRKPCAHERVADGFSVDPASIGDLMNSEMNFWPNLSTSSAGTTTVRQWFRECSCQPLTVRSKARPRRYRPGLLYESRGRIIRGRIMPGAAPAWP